MLKNKKSNQNFKVLSTIILFSSMLPLLPTLSSCGSTNNEAINIGSYDGTDWQGYVSGHLHCSINYNDTESVIISGYSEEGDTSNYKAHNLVIPDFIKYPNGTILPLKVINYAFNQSDNLTGTLTLGKNLVNIQSSFNVLTNVTGDLIIPNNVCFINYSFIRSGFDKNLVIGDMVEEISQNCFAQNNFDNLIISKYNHTFGLATNAGENCRALVAKNGDDDFLVDYSNPNSIISGLVFGTLEIPADTTNISGNLLQNCTRLSGITIEESDTSFYKIIKSGSGESGPNETISLNNPGFMIDTNDIPEEEGKDMAIRSQVLFVIGDLTIPDTILGHKVVAVGDKNNPDSDVGSGNLAFTGLNIGKLTTGVNLTTIYGSAFKNCSISEVNLTNVHTIHESAFEGNSITKVSMPKITSLSDEAFEFQSHITSITVDASVDPDTSLNVPDDHLTAVLFGSCKENTGELIDISGVGTYKNE
jgi:hypothetical protein